MTDVQRIGESFMSEGSGSQEQLKTKPAEGETEKDSTMPSVRKQIAVMGIIVVGITVVLGGGILLSELLR